MTSSLDTELPQLRPTRCAICDHEDDAGSCGPRPSTPQRSALASSRRDVSPTVCTTGWSSAIPAGLVRSDPVASEDLLATLYASSSFDYGHEVGAIQATYGRALEWLEARTPRREALLEIGCGNGFFLGQARRQGWQEVRGVERSSDAVAKAPPELEGMIVQDVMRGGLFAPESFDAVCLFQVLDHISNPVDVLQECLAVLRPGGHILALNHNIRGWSARMLGERSPIVDIEHTYLYSPATIHRVFAKAGFVDPQVRSVRNTYSLAYLLQLAPLPAGIKSVLLPALRASPAGRIRVTLPLGNLCLIARKPG